MQTINTVSFYRGPLSIQLIVNCNHSMCRLTAIYQKRGQHSSNYKKMMTRQVQPLQSTVWMWLNITNNKFGPRNFTICKAYTLNSHMPYQNKEKCVPCKHWVANCPGTVHTFGERLSKYMFVSLHCNMNILNMLIYDHLQLLYEKAITVWW